VMLLAMKNWQAHDAILRLLDPLHFGLVSRRVVATIKFACSHVLNSLTAEIIGDSLSLLQRVFSIVAQLQVL